MTNKVKLTIIGLILLFTIGVGAFRFDVDSQKFFKFRNTIYQKGGHRFSSELHQLDKLTNPLIKLYARYYQFKFERRFIHQSESYSYDTDSELLKNISSIYRDYWVQDFMKHQLDSTDYNSLFVKKIATYLIENSLSKLNKDSVRYFHDILKDLKVSIENEGAHCAFFYLDDKHDIIIWKTQNIENYSVATPYETRIIPVVFYSEKIIENRRHFITFGSQKTAGWPNNQEGVIYSGDYDTESELFKLSFLKHEANHFFDNEKYPKLSAADLEYRSKLIELIYVKENKNRIIREFLSGASSKNRSHGHAYANFKIIEHLSLLIFDKSFEGNYTRWKKISTNTINDSALELFEENQKIVDNNPYIEEII